MTRSQGRRESLRLYVLGIACSLAAASVLEAQDDDFRRGETNADLRIDISDPVFTLNFLFVGGPEIQCFDAGDSNDDGRLDISDAIHTLRWLFLGGTEPPAPGPFDCGPDPSPDSLGCALYAGCEAGCGSAPAADAGRDRAYPLGTAVKLDGSASSDAESNTLTFSWRLIARPAESVAALDDPASAAPIFEADRVGEYRFELVVSDCESSSDPDTVTFTAVNSTPTADAGLDRTARVGEAVTLEGTGVDPDGDPVAFRWSFTARPGGSAAALSSPGAAAPSFIPDRTGEYALELEVTDGRGGSALDAVTIRAGHAPRITSTPITLATVGRPYGYDVEVEDGDPGDVHVFALERAPLGMDIDSGSGLIAWTPLEGQVGDHEVRIVVEDSAGLGDIQRFEVRVLAPAPPSAADDEYSVRIGETLAVPAPGVLANDSDPNGDPLSASILAGPRNGNLSLEPDGSFTYTPDTLVPGTMALLEEGNLCQSVPGAVLTASSESLFRSPDGGFAVKAIDGRLGSSWIGNNFGPKPDFLEISFPHDVTVERIEVYGHRDPFIVQSNFAFLKTATIQVFDAANAVLFDSGPVALPPPLHDLALDIPRTEGVRRVRITDAGPEHNTGLAEFRVLGSAVIEREDVTPADENLTQLLAVTPRTSGNDPNRPAETVVDGQPGTTWYPAAASPIFFEIELPADATLTAIQTFNPGNTRAGFGTSVPVNCFGKIEVFDSAGAVLFDSGELNEPSGFVNSSDSFTLTLPGVSGARRVRYTQTRPCTSEELGFSEIRVLGTPSIPVDRVRLATKFEALSGLNVHSTPLVVNLTDDNGDGAIDLEDVPDVVVTVEQPGSDVTGTLRAVSGADGSEIFVAGGDSLVSPWSDAAAGDIDGDGLVEIITAHSNGQQLIAFEHDGAPKWLSDVRTLPGRFCAGRNLDGICTFFVGGAVSIANLDGQGPPEIVVGATVYDHEGHILGDGRDLGGTTAGGLDPGGIRNGSQLRSAISAIADIDLDGAPEIVAGPTAYRLVDRQLVKVWQRADRPDGFVGIGNFDDDAEAEIVLVGLSQVQMLNHDGTDAEFWNLPTHGPVTLPGGGAGGSGTAGGAPTISDFDADGLPEIGIAGAGSYVVYERDGTVLWRASVSDFSSAATGSSTFDFDLDGSVEVIYRDERHLRIFRGADGLLLAKEPVGSSTWVEQPVIADVDNDGHADILVTSDSRITSQPADSGVLVFQDVGDRWVRTRRIWNQHSYHITNVNEDGTIPLVEKPNWLEPGLNDFRLNTYPAREEGRDSFQYEASDGALSGAATVRIRVRQLNTAPEIRSTPPALAAAGVPYAYLVLAVDPDAEDELSLSLPSAPAGMTLEEPSRVEWTPSDAQLGSQEVLLRVEDSQGFFALQPFTVTVVDPATVPDVVGDPRPTAEAEILAASLTVGAVLEEHSLAVPAGSVARQDPEGGAAAVPGSAVRIVVSLGRSPADTDDDGDGFTENGGDCDDADDRIHPGAPDAPGNGIDEDCDGIDPPDPRARDDDGDGISELAGDCDDGNAGIGPGGTEVAGNDLDEDCNGADAVEGDVTSPVAAIEGPGEDIEVLQPTDIVGTVSDANFLRYRLFAAPVDGDVFIEIGSGTAPVTSGVLGTLDPTLLENGFYRVQLFAEDANGQLGFDERVYRVTGEAKIGVFALSFIDLRVPVSGIPITVIRAYDSRVKERRDFGIGWSLEVKTGSYRHNRPPGLGWSITKAPGPFGLPCRVVSELAAHLTEVRLSDREFYLFRPKLADVAALGGGCVGSVEFELVDGTFPDATLEIIGSRDIIFTSGSALTVFDGTEDTGLVFEPREVRLTTIDGRIIDFDLESGITRLEDVNENTLTIGHSGIEHASGKSIAFDRDAAGRIRRITDPMGHTLQYEYDADGNLAAFIDQEGLRMTFRYDGDHNLIDLIDPAGNRSARCEYDEEGRLVAIVDAAGRRTEFGHDVEGREEVITDSLGNATRYVYDERGNVISHETPVTIEGVRVVARHELSHDANGNPTVVVDPDGLREENSWDEGGNQLSRTRDPAGLAIRNEATYAPDGQPLTQKDANGDTIRFSYDGRGNMTGWVDVDGAPASMDTDQSGRITSYTDPELHETKVFYDGSGNPTSREDSLGNVTAYTYDANGNRLTETRSRTVSGELRTLTRRFEYDARNRIVRVIDPLGNETRYEYDALGRRAAITDPLGRVTRFEHDRVGDLVRIAFADGTDERREYDEGGNLIRVVDREGLETRFEYDELRRLTKTVLPNGGESRTIYTPAGRVAASFAPDDSRTDYEYDSAGRLVLIRRPEVIDAATGSPARPEWRFEYDAGGRRTAQIDPRGHRTRFIYDSAAMTVTTRFPDGVETVVEHDRLGRMIRASDPDGNVTSFEYLADTDRLTAVSLSPPEDGAAAPVWTFEHDEAGNVVSRTDPLERTTRFEYDELGRRTRTTLPGGNSSTRSFDAAGRLVEILGLDGGISTFEYDLGDRLVRKELPGGVVTRFTYTPGGRRSSAVDDRGTTSYEYDAAGRLARAEQPGAGAVAYAYDALNRVTRITTGAASTEYDYDALNRLTGVTSPEGSASYRYDLAGNAASAILPNGVEMDAAHDQRGRTTSLRYTSGGSLLGSFAYGYTAGGRVRTLTEPGATTTFSYDRIGRLVGEARAGAAPFTRTYEYDAAGNRIRSVADGVETLYTYDDDDRLLTAGGESFQYDDRGNLVRVDAPGGATTYSWTPDDRLSSVQAGGDSVAYRYDADGFRVEKDSAQGTVRYLVDGLNPSGLRQVLEERDDSGSLVARSVYGRGPLSRSAGGSSRFFMADALSHVRMATDPEGGVAAAYTYDAFGNLEEETGSAAEDRLLNGQELDRDIGLYYLRARYYDPRTGRFLGLDPRDGIAELPLTFHRYLYAANDPVNFADPTGEFFSVIGFAIGNVLAQIDNAIEASTKTFQACKVKTWAKVATWMLAIRGMVSDRVSSGFEIGSWFNIISSLSQGNAPSLSFGASVKLVNYTHPWASLSVLSGLQASQAKGQVKELTLTATLKTSDALEFELKGTEFGSSASVSAKVSFSPLTGSFSGFESGVENEWKVADIEVCGVEVGAAKLFLAGTVGANAAQGSAVASAELGIKADLIFFPEIKRSIIKIPDDFK